MFIKLCLCIALVFSGASTRDQPITIIGKALNAKAGAVVVSDKNGTYYVQGLDSWDKQFYGKQVKVSGILWVKKYKKRMDSVEVQEIKGDVRIIQKPKWELVK